MIKAIVFDFDGVLADSVNIKTEAFAELFKDQTPEILEKIIKYHKANGGISRYEKFRYFYNHLLNRSLSKDEEEQLGDRFSKLVVSSVIESPWVPGSRDALESLYAELPLYVASGTPETELLQIVAARGMSHYFKGIHGAPKQKKTIIQKTIDGLKVRPDRIVMVGDAVSDYLAAKETGVLFLGRITEGKNPFADKNVQTILNLENLKETISKL